VFGYAIGRRSEKVIAKKVATVAENDEVEAACCGELGDDFGRVPCP
jgi:hypothetical protein